MAASEDATQQDPWDWTVDEVVIALCDPSGLFRSTKNPQSLPDATLLEQKLREHYIEGCSLLTDIDHASLKEDLGIIPLGQRGHVLREVIRLRSCSGRYQEHRRHVAPDASYGFASNTGTTRQAIPIHQWQLGTLQNAAPAQPITPIRSPPNAAGYFGPPQRHPPITPAGDQSGLQTSLLNSGESAVHPPDEAPVLPGDGDCETFTGEPPVFRQHETSFIDEKGNKRRRLVLANSPSTAVDNTLGTASPETLNSEPKAEQVRVASNELPYTDDHVSQSGRRRIAPTLVSLPQLGNETTKPELANTEETDGSTRDHVQSGLSHLRTPSQSYLGMKAILVDDIFYDLCLSGHKLNRNSLPNVPAADYNNNPLEGFKFNGIPVSNGQRHYIASRIKYFLLQNVATFRRGSQHRYGIRPYPDRLGRRHQPLSLTIFDNADNQVCASRQDRSLWLEFDAPSRSAQNLVQDSQKTEHLNMPTVLQDDAEQDWDYLKKWDYADMEPGSVLPLYGESGSEGEYDLDTWREMEKEMGSKLPKPLGPSKGSKRMSEEAVSDTIKAAIQQMIVDWKQKVLPKLERKAWILWSKSRRNGTKQLKVSSLEYDLQHLGARLEKLTEEIHYEQWPSALKLHKQCESMRRTIYEREESQWMVDILQSKQRPEKSPNIPKNQKKGISKPRLSHDAVESDLESNGYATSVGDDLDDFIVDDDVSSSVGEDLTVMNAEDGPQDETCVDLLSEGTTPDKENQPKLDDSLDAWKPSRKSLSASKYTTTLAPPRPPPTADVIDLTMDSDNSESEPVAPPLANKIGTPTPVANETKKITNERHQKKAALFKSPPNMEKIKDVEDLVEGPMSQHSVPSKMPALSDIKQIGEMSRTLLMERADRKRLLIYVLTKVDIQRRKDVYLYINNHVRGSVQKGVWNAFKSITGFRSRVIGAESQEESEILKSITAWFINWTNIIIVSPGMGASHKQIKDAEEDREGFKPFHTFLLEIRCLSDYDPDSATVRESERPTPSKKKRLLINYEEEHNDLPAKSAKKRKYVVPESQEAAELRKKAQQRVVDREQRQRKLNENLQEMGRTEEDAAQVIVNVGKLDNQELIYLRPSIGARIQPHQKEGLRFLWREIIEDHASQQGCLLAQAMGLGKTMQVISFLVTIALAVKSPNLNIRSQIPDRLHRSQTLVLCPPSLVENWYEEFLLWAQNIEENVGDVRIVNSVMHPQDRFQTILDWGGEGGVLILGYSILKDVIGNAGANEQAEDDAGLREVRDTLLKRTNIVIADEAHTAKNPHSKINKVLNRFETPSRIALTGSPLSNNLSEYYVLIEWIAPGYLGEHREFVFKYEEPIHQGLYSDSTERQWRNGLKKLELFKREVQPKVHRADIAVLASRLQGKSEFVIKVDRTQLQEKLYQSFVGSMNKRFRGSENPQLTTLWSWIAILRLVCNHPKCHYDKLMDKGPRTKRPKRARATVDDETNRPTADEDPSDESLTSLGISDEFTRHQLHFFNELTGPIESIALSYKMKLLLQILDLCKEAGDRALVFSHSLTTLNYIEFILDAKQKAFFRMDGSLRTDLRQAMTKKFNQGPTDILLISTRAGGTGLNLFGANRVIIVDDHFNPAWEEQAVGRAYRIGQTKHVYVYRLTVGGTFEEALHNQSLFKQQLATRAVDRKNIARLATRNTKEYMRPLETLEQTDLGPMKGKDSQVLDKILASQASDPFIRAIVPCETFQQEVDEELTAEERREVEQEEADSRLRRTDPDAYQAKVKSRSAPGIRVSQPHTTTPNSGLPSSSKNSSKSPKPPAAEYLAKTNHGLPSINGHSAVGSPVRARTAGVGPEALSGRLSISKTAAMFGILVPNGNNAAKEGSAQGNGAPPPSSPHPKPDQETLLPILGANTTLSTTTSMPPEQQPTEGSTIRRAKSEPWPTPETLQGLAAASASESARPALSARYSSLQNLLEREEKRARHKEAMGLGS
ncbi:MAG: hypothetical protein Q9222_006334 [Ikaeria aurantiellina]